MTIINDTRVVRLQRTAARLGHQHSADQDIRESVASELVTASDVVALPPGSLVTLQRGPGAGLTEEGSVLNATLNDIGGVAGGQTSSVTFSSEDAGATAATIFVTEIDFSLALSSAGEYAINYKTFQIKTFTAVPTTPGSRILITYSWAPVREYLEFSPEDVDPDLVAFGDGPHANRDLIAEGQHIEITDIGDGYKEVAVDTQSLAGLGLIVDEENRLEVDVDAYQVFYEDVNNELIFADNVQDAIDSIDGYLGQLAFDSTISEHFNQVSEAIATIRKDLDGYHPDVTGQEHYNQLGDAILAIRKELDGYDDQRDLSGIEGAIQTIIKELDGYQTQITGLDQTVSEHNTQTNTALQTIIKELDGYNDQRDLSGIEGAIQSILKDLDGYASDQTVSEHHSQVSTAIQTIIKELDGYNDQQDLSGIEGAIQTIIKELDGYNDQRDLSGLEGAIQSILKDLDGYALQSDLLGLDQTEQEHHSQLSIAIQSILQSLDGYAGASGVSEITFLQNKNSTAEAIQTIIKELDGYNDQRDLSGIEGAIQSILKDLDGYHPDITGQQHYNQLSDAIITIRKDLDGYAAGTSQTESEHHQQVSEAIITIRKDLDGYLTAGDINLDGYAFDSTVSEHFNQLSTAVETIRKDLDGYASDQTVSEHHDQISNALQSVLQSLDGYHPDITGQEHYNQLGEAIITIRKELDGYASDQTESEHFQQHSDALQTILSALDGYSAGAGSQTVHVRKFGSEADDTPFNSVFSLDGNTYTVGQSALLVFVNGIAQFPSTDYVEASTTTIEFTTPINNSDIVDIVILPSVSAATASQVNLLEGCGINLVEVDGYTEVSIDIQSLAGEGLVVVSTTDGCGELAVDIDAYQVSYDDSSNSIISGNNVQEAIDSIDGYLQSLGAGQLVHVRKFGSEADDTPFNSIFSLDGNTYTTGQSALLVFVNGIAQFPSTDYVEASTTTIEFTTPINNSDIVDIVILPSVSAATASQISLLEGCGINLIEVDGYTEVSIDIQSLAGTGLVVESTPDGCGELAVDLDAYQVSYDDSNNSVIFGDNVQEAIDAIDGYLQDLGAGQLVHVRKFGSEADDTPFNSVFNLDGNTYQIGQNRLLVFINGIAQFTPSDFTEASTTTIELSDPVINDDVIDILILPASFGGSGVLSLLEGCGISLVAVGSSTEVSIDIQSLAGTGLVVESTPDGCGELAVDLDAYQVGYDPDGNAIIFSDNVQDAITEIDGYLQNLNLGGSVVHIRQFGSDAVNAPFNSIFDLDGNEYPLGQDRLLVWVNGIAQFPPTDFTERSTDSIELSTALDIDDILDILILPGSLGGGGTTNLQSAYDNSASAEKDILLDDGQITFTQTLSSGSALRLVTSDASNITPTLRVVGDGYFDGSLEIDGYSIHNSGNVINRVSTADSMYLDGSQHLVAFADTSVARTAFLPDAKNLEAGHTFIIKDESGAASVNNITIQPADAGQTIDGVSSVTISTNFGSQWVYTDGVNWFTM